MATTEHDQITETVRRRYAAAASAVRAGGELTHDDPITSNLYAADQAAVIPLSALTASLGCGNPTLLAELHPGERVLDLGSGGGIDVLLSARRVGPTGHAWGLDMTDEMLALAEANRQQAGAENVTFLKGRIEAIPLDDGAVDVIISNCVINLAADKRPVLREAFRVLAPGGRFAVSDVVTRGQLPADLKADMESWVGCVAGALDEQAYVDLLTEAGFVNISVQITRDYDPRELQASMSGIGCCGSSPAGSACCSGPTAASAPVWDESAYQRFAQSGGAVMSAFIRAEKPA